MCIPEFQEYPANYQDFAREMSVTLPEFDRESPASKARYRVSLQVTQLRPNDQVHRLTLRVKYQEYPVTRRVSDPASLDTPGLHGPEECRPVPECQVTLPE